MVKLTSTSILVSTYRRLARFQLYCEDMKSDRVAICSLLVHGLNVQEDALLDLVSLG
jgi:hypothetical protein